MVDKAHRFLQGGTFLAVMGYCLLEGGRSGLNPTVIVFSLIVALIATVVVSGFINFVRNVVGF